MPIDYKKYPVDWKQIRARILEREGNACKFCGVKNYAMGSRAPDGTFYDESQVNGMNSDVGYHIFGDFGVKRIKIVLTVAHLDHDITNNSDENLAALCQRCHLRHDHEHHRKNSSETRRKNKGLQNLFTFLSVAWDLAYLIELHRKTPFL